MNLSELELPKDLYTEEASPCGTKTRIVYAPDKLVAWSEQWRGNAIHRLCNQAYKRKISDIDAWEIDRVRQLQGSDRMAAANDEDVFALEDEDAKRLRQAREAIAREAERKRASVKESVADQRTAIEQLVQEAREYIEAHEAAPHDDHLLAYLFFIGAVIVAGQVLFG
jgi:hypothetical protein